MAFTKVTGHQEESAVLCVLDLANMVSGANTICEIPAGAIVTGGFIAVTTAYSDTCTLDIGDAGTANRYANDVNIAATGTTNLSITGYEASAANGLIKITPSAVDASSPSGAAIICIKYVVVGRESFAVG